MQAKPTRTANRRPPRRRPRGRSGTRHPRSGRSICGRAALIEGNIGGWARPVNSHISDLDAYELSPSYVGFPHPEPPRRFEAS